MVIDECRLGIDGGSEMVIHRCIIMHNCRLEKLCNCAKSHPAIQEQGPQQKSAH